MCSKIVTLVCIIAELHNIEVTRLGLATLLRRVNKQNFKVHFKNLLFFLFLVLFCCDVDESELELKARCVPPRRLYKKCNLRSENEVIYEKLIY